MTKFDDDVRGDPVISEALTKIAKTDLSRRLTAW